MWRIIKKEKLFARKSIWNECEKATEREREKKKNEKHSSVQGKKKTNEKVLIWTSFDELENSERERIENATVS